jgi:hypothetical protein
VRSIRYFIFGIFLILLSCKNTLEHEETLFYPIDMDKSGIDFINQLDQTEELNTYTFRNFYNGAALELVILIMTVFWISIFVGIQEAINSILIRENLSLRILQISQV